MTRNHAQNLNQFNGEVSIKLAIRQYNFLNKPEISLFIYKKH